MSNMTSTMKEREMRMMDGKKNTNTELKDTKKRKPKATNNGSGRTFRRGKNWAYEIRRQYWDGNKTVKANRYCGQFKTKTEADKARFAAIEELEKEIEAGKRGELIAGGHNKMTLKELGDAFIAIHETSWSKKTNQYMRTNLGKCKDYYDRTWESISILEFQRMINIGQTYDTAKKMKLLLGGMERLAVKTKQASEYRVAECKLPGAPIVNKAIFEREERDILWEAAKHNPPYADMSAHDDMAVSALLIMMHTGMRPNELRTIDAKEYVEEKNKFTKGGIKTYRGKTGSIFVIPLIEDLVKKWVFPQNQFAGVSIETIRKRVNTLLEKLGLPHHVLSACRTTTATVLAEAGVSDEDLRVIMRHTDSRIVRKYYDKSGDEHAQKALERFDSDRNEIDDESEERTITLTETEFNNRIGEAVEAAIARFLAAQNQAHATA